jgi:hypothetical protein
VTCLRRLIDEPDRRQRIAAAGQARARSFGPDAFATTVAAALVATTRRARDVRSG